MDDFDLEQDFADFVDQGRDLSADFEETLAAFDSERAVEEAFLSVVAEEFGGELELF